VTGLTPDLNLTAELEYDHEKQAIHSALLWFLSGNTIQTEPENL
jgi:hypothetical protein